VIFSRGFRFNPTPLEAATYYLPRLIAGAPLHEAVRPVVNHADVYGSEPGDLARQFCPLPRTGHRFFFTHCKLQQPQKAGKAGRPVRASGAGSWHSQGVKDVVDHAGAKVGEVTKLKYKKGGANTEWLMDEYSCCLEDAVAGDRRYVLCNMYVSPRAEKDSAERQESAAFFAPPARAPAPVVIAQAAAPAKRPAPPQSAEPPCPKRMRGAVAPTPPALQPAGCTASLAPPPQFLPHTTASAQPPCPKRMPGAVAPTPQVVQPAGYRTAASFAPPLPCVPHIATSAQPPPPPVPTRLAAPPKSRPPAPKLLQLRSPPKQQAPPPPPILPVAVRAPCRMAVEAPARHRQPPQPSAQRKQRMRDPFEAAEQLGDEAEEEKVAAPDPKECPAALVDEDGVWAELKDCLEDDGVPAAEGSTMSEEEMDEHLATLFEEEENPDAAIEAPDPAALQGDLDLFQKILEETMAAVC
jgi:hypothetical protein